MKKKGTKRRKPVRVMAYTRRYAKHDPRAVRFDPVVCGYVMEEYAENAGLTCLDVVVEAPDAAIPRPGLASVWELMERFGADGLLVAGMDELASDVNPEEVEDARQLFEKMDRKGMALFVAGWKWDSREFQKNGVTLVAGLEKAVRARDERARGE